jgi:ankyrin repeat protein
MAETKMTNTRQDRESQGCILPNDRTGEIIYGSPIDLYGFGNPMNLRKMTELRLAFAAACLILIAPMPARAEAGACADLERRFEAGRSELAAPQVSALLFGAADNGCATLAQRLLEAGASVQAQDREGSMALIHAARAGHAPMIKLLLDHGADVNQRNIKGATPLYIAAENNRERAAQELLDQGADVNLPGRSNVSALSAAAFTGNGKIVDLLIGRGADIHWQDSTGKTAIVYAAARGFVPIVESLLAGGVDVNARYGNDLTVLMWASGHANDVPEDDGLRLVQLLLERGAHIDDVDDRGRSALMDAAELDHGAIAEWLVARGAKRDLRDKDGKTAADLALSPRLRARLTN